MDMWQRIKVQEAQTTKPQPPTTKPVAPQTQGPVAAPAQRELTIPNKLTPPEPANPVGNAIAQVGNVVSGIAKGVVDIGAGVVSAVQDFNAASMAASQAAGLDPTIDPSLAPGETYAQRAQISQQYSNAALQWGQGATSQIDKVAESIIPAPASPVAGVIAKGADVVGRAIPNIAAAAVIGPVAAGGIGATQVYGNERIGGASPGEAIGPAVAAGVAEGIGAKVFNPGGALGKIVEGSPIASAALDAVGEGLEENIESILQGKAPTLEEFGYGAVAGAILGPAAQGVQSQMQKSAFDKGLRNDFAQAAAGNITIEASSSVPGTRGVIIEANPRSGNEVSDTPPTSAGPEVPGSGPGGMPGNGPSPAPASSPVEPDTPEGLGTDNVIGYSGDIDSGSDTALRGDEVRTMVDTIETLPQIIILDELPGGAATLDELIDSPPISEQPAATEVDTGAQIEAETVVPVEPQAEPQVQEDVQPVVESQDNVTKPVLPQPGIFPDVQPTSMPNLPSPGAVPETTPEPSITPGVTPQTIPSPTETPLNEPFTTPEEIPQQNGLQPNLTVTSPSEITASPEVMEQWGLNLTEQITESETGSRMGNNIGNNIKTGLASDFGVTATTETDNDKPQRPGTTTIFRGLGAGGEVYATESYEKTWGKL